LPNPTKTELEKQAALEKDSTDVTVATPRSGGLQSHHQSLISDPDDLPAKMKVMGFTLKYFTPPNSSKGLGNCLQCSRDYAREYFKELEEINKPINLDKPISFQTF
jgi:hypothetical protein